MILGDVGLQVEHDFLPGLDPVGVLPAAVLLLQRMSLVDKLCYLVRLLHPRFQVILVLTELI